MITIDTGRTERFDLGRVMERTFTVIGKNFTTFLPAAIFLVGIPSVVMVLAQGGSPLPQSSTGWLMMSLAWALSLVGTYLLLPGGISVGALLQPRHDPLTS